MSSQRRVLLAHSYFLAYDPKQVRKMRPYPPLATLITASLLRKAGWEVSLFDAMLSKGEEEFAALVESERPALVGILEDNFNFLTKMCTVRMREAALRMIGDAKRAGALVAVNGSDAADRPELYLGAGADAVVLGEAEETFLELAEAWSRDPRADLSEVFGLAVPNGSAEPFRRTPPRPFVEGLDALPFPAWDLVDADRYRRAWTGAHGRLSWNMATTRGCPYRCNWCAKPLYGTRYAQRSPGNVAEEMRLLSERVGPDHVWFADDIFGLSPRWIESFAEAVASRGARIPFTIQSRVDLMTPSAVEALRHAGCEEVWMGVESGSQAILDAMDKGTTLSQVRGATRLLKESGIRASWFLQLGYPGEEWHEVEKTRDLIREERPDDVGVSVAYPLPGTLFFDRVKDQLGAQTNWSDSDDLAMIFHGTYTGPFYRRVRDLLHEEALVALLPEGDVSRERRRQLDVGWEAAAQEEAAFRSESPSLPRAARAR
ncbi:B12-binding domain-containing radical SAM protein [Acidobacteria bacterium ACD]|nr:MAG: radical SAM protein [Acidobacteriota bacterium]MCE7959657.1 radical SAM protein [Acidobacteria bacterium ACB2]MDL1950967.1 B12-binding domain-containing radical SAM protein [Acidobacteria bacterium ACD]